MCALCKLYVLVVEIDGMWYSLQLNVHPVTNGLNPTSSDSELGVFYRRHYHKHSQALARLGVNWAWWRFLIRSLDRNFFCSTHFSHRPGRPQPASASSRRLIAVQNGVEPRQAAGPRCIAKRIFARRQVSPTTHSIVSIHSPRGRPARSRLNTCARCQRLSTPEIY